jgi:RecA/RadA recombinase
MSSFECQFVQYTNEPLDLSFDTVSCIQVRFSPKAFGGRGRMKEVTCGGNALRFYAAVRLRLSRKGLIKTEDKVNS